MRLRFALFAAISLALVSGSPVLAKDQGKLVSQSMVEKEGPIAFKVAGLGEFEIVSLSQSAKPGKECHVLLASLGEQMTKGHRTGELRLQPGKTSAIGLALTTCPTEGGEELCCMGAGSDCEISVGVIALY